MRARVELVSGSSFTNRKGTYVRGQPKVLTDPGTIQSLQKSGRFAVTLLQEPVKRKAAPEPEPKKVLLKDEEDLGVEEEFEDDED